MNKAMSIAFLSAGVVLIVLGINASNSIGSDVSRLFTGTPSDKAIWLLVGGVVLAVLGSVGLSRGAKH